MAINQATAKASSRSKTENVLEVFFSFLKGEKECCHSEEAFSWEEEERMWWGFRNFSKHSPYRMV